jgi:hypothetical protein
VALWVTQTVLESGCPELEVRSSHPVRAPILQAMTVSSWLSNDQSDHSSFFFSSHEILFVTIKSLECNSIDDFHVGVTLGTGSFGRVRFATHKGTQQHFAVKILRKTEVIRHKQVCDGLISTSVS